VKLALWLRERLMLLLEGFFTPAGRVRLLLQLLLLVVLLLLLLPEVLERDLSLLCVSRCCFMLSARVNFFGHPSYVQCTPFSAVWILE
jgi:hypothetical protein